MKHLTTTAGIVFCVVFSLAAPPALGAEKDVLPPSDQTAKERLEKSPRHGEMVDVTVPGMQAKMKAYVVYPESKEKAPVVIVIQEIFGLSDWIRGVADQLAADGFIAVAPDMLSGRGPNGGGTEAFASGDDVRRAVQGIKPEEAKAMLDATREYGIKLPAANGKSATIGFCWGGGASFRYATQQPDLNAAVVYYGTSPQAGYESIKAPVLGIYGENDQRVNATIEPAKQKMKQGNKKYEVNIYPGAGHGFLRQQGGQNGANKTATEKAWPETIKFLREHTK
jgi:carboxymethylenebutenolidase